MEIDSLGLRDVERILAKHPGVFRIAVFGDSVTSPRMSLGRQTAAWAERPRRRLVGLAQKAHDFGDFMHQRIRMRFRLHLNRIRHRRLFGDRVGRILIVRLASIGDVVRASAVVHCLRERYPNAEIDFLTTEVALPVIQRNPALTAVYTLGDLPRLGPYDWLVNLQNRDPPDGFLQGSGFTYRDVLEHLSFRLGCRFLSGRHIEDGRETSPTDINYCVSEMEELFMIALLPFDLARYPTTKVFLDERAHGVAQRKFAVPPDRPAMALFFGSNSVGCGADEGFRTYSVEYLGQLVARFYDRFTIVIVGQSQTRSSSERERYADLLKRYPRVVDLVDQTSLGELVSVIDGLQLLVTCDSSPVHIALARGVPVVGLYVNDATFRMSPALENDQFICLNSTPPCFKYSWRWKFFCGTCRDARTRAYYCHNDAFAFGVDRIPIDRVEVAIRKVLSGRLAQPGARSQAPPLEPRSTDVAVQG